MLIPVQRRNAATVCPLLMSYLGAGKQVSAGSVDSSRTKPGNRSWKPFDIFRPRFKSSV
jgi:hypothetical protein